MWRTRPWGYGIEPNYNNRAEKLRVERHVIYDQEKKLQWRFGRAAVFARLELRHWRAQFAIQLVNLRTISFLNNCICAPWSQSTNLPTQEICNIAGRQPRGEPRERVSQLLDLYDVTQIVRYDTRHGIGQCLSLLVIFRYHRNVGELKTENNLGISDHVSVTFEHLVPNELPSRASNRSYSRVRAEETKGPAASTILTPQHESSIGEPWIVTRGVFRLTGEFICRKVDKYSHQIR